MMSRNSMFDFVSCGIDTNGASLPGSPQGALWGLVCRLLRG